MKVSYNWIQEYIKDPLPKIESLSNSLTMNSFEVEGVEDMGGDSIIDVKILPNRASDCLCHYGIANEIASVCGLQRKDLLEKLSLPKTEKIKLSVSTKFCDKAYFILIRDVKVDESPEWLRDKLAVLGHRSINSVVDLTNYLTFAFGYPMHAFDAEKISLDNKFNYEINIRNAKEGEQIKLLNGTDYKLSSDMVVIADGVKALDVAGVMGGDDTGVTSHTKNIIISLSHFNPVSIRKTAKKLGIRTEASYRFENGMSLALAERALPYLIKNIVEITGGVVDGVSLADDSLEENKIVKVTSEKISSILGVSIDDETIISILEKQKISVKKANNTLEVDVPKERLDLTMEESIAEEVGRIYGYENINPLKLDGKIALGLNIKTFVIDRIKSVLVSNGFSEIYTYALVKYGDVELENPISSDKKFMRKNLANPMSDALEHNSKYVDLLGIDEIKIFEIGKVFDKNGEYLHLSIGVKNPKNKKANVDEEVAKIINVIESELDISLGDISIVGGIAEFDLDRVLGEITAPSEYGNSIWNMDTKENFVWKPISQYPFAVRDVAVFVPNETGIDAVTELIKKNLNSTVVRFSLFDTFVKGEKTSYAFRLVFQSNTKTLTEDEINAVMNPIYDTLKSENGFEIR